VRQGGKKRGGGSEGDSPVVCSSVKIELVRNFISRGRLPSPAAAAVQGGRMGSERGSAKIDLVVLVLLE